MGSHCTQIPGPANVKGGPGCKDKFIRFKEHLFHTSHHPISAPAVPLASPSPQATQGLLSAVSPKMVSCLLPPCASSTTSLFSWESISPSSELPNYFVLTSPVAKSCCPSYSHLCSRLISPSSQHTPQ